MNNLTVCTEIAAGCAAGCREASAICLHNMEGFGTDLKPLAYFTFAVSLFYVAKGGARTIQIVNNFVRNYFKSKPEFLINESAEFMPDELHTFKELKPSPVDKTFNAAEPFVIALTIAVIAIVILKAPSFIEDKICSKIGKSCDMISNECNQSCYTTADGIGDVVEHVIKDIFKA